MEGNAKENSYLLIKISIFVKSLWKILGCKDIGGGYPCGPQTGGGGGWKGDGLV